MDEEDGAEAAPSPDERVGPRYAELMARRAKSYRRMAWMLVAGVLFWLFLLWWY